MVFAVGTGICEQGDERDSIALLVNPRIYPGFHVPRQTVRAVAGNDDNVRGESVFGGHFSQLRNAENIELPHLVAESTLVAKVADKKVERLFGMFAGVEILISDYNIKNGIRFQV